MRISDWSSDVCSSDLCAAYLGHARQPKIGRFGNQSGEEGLRIAGRQAGRDVPEVLGEAGPPYDLRQHDGTTRGRQHTVAGKRQMTEMDEGRVGKECVHTCIYRVLP